VAGNLYPIVKMGWVQGETLDSFIKNQLRNPTALYQLAETFRGCIQYLQQVDIAHGDLQHGNIMVLPDGNIRLIDYDGIYVPGMSLGQGHEKGHPNYQHPARDVQHFGPNMDRFSAICIYVSLKALSVRPDLWDRYHSQENIIFRAEDFKDPDNSPLFSELCTLRGIADYAERFKEICRLRIEDVPTLEAFILGIMPAPSTTWRSYRSPSAKPPAQPQPTTHVPPAPSTTRRSYRRFKATLVGLALTLAIVSMMLVLVYAAVSVIVLTPPDSATSWTARASGTWAWLSGVTYGNGTFVAVGEGGVILTSPDGVTWTKRASGTENTLHGVTYGNGTFVAVGEGGVILTSP